MTTRDFIFVRGALVCRSFDELAYSGPHVFISVCNYCWSVLKELYPSCVRNKDMKNKSTKALYIWTQIMLLFLNVGKVYKCISMTAFSQIDLIYSVEDIKTHL